VNYRVTFIEDHFSWFHCDVIRFAIMSIHFEWLFIVCFGRFVVYALVVEGAKKMS
jgi:hypothetical protein